MKWTMAAVLCVAFTLRASGQSEVQKPPVALTWNYDAQQKTLTLHLANYSGKDISAYNISIAERYTDGSTNPSRLDGIPCFPGEKMEEMLGAMVNFQLSKTEGRHGVAWAGVLVNGQRAPGTVDVERMRREFSNDVFAAGTTRDQVIPEAKDISDVDAVVDMVIYADATADVQNERAFRQLMAMRKGQLLAMEKVNEVVKRVLADPMVDSPISAALAELTPLADVPQGKNRPPEDPAFSQAMYLQGAVKNFQHMQPWRMNMTEREYLTGYLDGQEKRVALISPHCEIVRTARNQ
jgi:hypothetical protein